MIYFIQMGEGPVKIGYTSKDSVERRLASLQVGSPWKLRLLGTIPGTEDDEYDLHQMFAEHRLQGEWFEADTLPELAWLLTSLRLDEQLADELLAMAQHGGRGGNALRDLGLRGSVLMRRSHMAMAGTR